MMRPYVGLFGNCLWVGLGLGVRAVVGMYVWPIPHICVQIECAVRCNTVGTYQLPKWNCVQLLLYSI